MVGVRGLAGEVGEHDILVEDVLRMRGEGVRDPRQRRGGPGHRRRHRREVRVQVRHFVVECQPGEGERLDHIIVAQFHELAEVARHCRGHARFRCGLGEGLPEAAGARGPIDVDDLGADAGEFGVEAGVRARAQGEDHEVFSGGFAGEDLGDDEGLGEPRVHLEYIGTAAGLSCLRC